MRLRSLRLQWRAAPAPNNGSGPGADETAGADEAAGAEKLEITTILEPLSLSDV